MVGLTAALLLGACAVEPESAYDPEMEAKAMRTAWELMPTDEQAQFCEIWRYDPEGVLVYAHEVFEGDSPPDPWLMTTFFDSRCW